MTFADRCIQDGKLTPAGERVCEIVYEKLTGKCWHEWNTKPDEHGEIDRACTKCGHMTLFWGKQIIQGNPALAFSLDAWKPIWEGMDSGVFEDIDNKLRAIEERDCIWTPRFPSEMQYLEAALRACGEYEQWEATND